MKQIKIFLLVAAMGLMACEPLTQTAQSSYDTSSVYSNVALARYAINGIYFSYAENGYGTDYFLYYGPNTDTDVVLNSTDDVVPNRCRYEISVTDPKFDNPQKPNTVIYGGNYAGIEKANIALRGMEENGDIQNNKEMAALYGEVLTVRALLYTDLMNIYGEVPARFDPITPETMYLPKADKDVLYKQLLSDLEQAATMMEFKDLPRVTQPGKACALGLYARLALQAAGYSLRPEDGMVNTGDPGRIRKSTDPELQPEVLYPKALKALQQIIDYGGFRLYDNYEDLWKAYCGQDVSLGHEIIYGLPVNGSGMHLRYQALPDAHLFPSDLNSTYNGCQPNLWFKYKTYDQRRDITCYPAKIGKDGKADGTTVNPNHWYCGKFRDMWLPFHRNDRNDADKCKYTYLRYADILLMAAEIANELPEADGGGLAKAKEYLRPVMVRAYKSEVKADAYLAELTDHDSFFDAIVDQRGFEFVGEGLRRTDLIRWNLLKAKLDECKADLEDMKASRGKWYGMPTHIYWRIKPESLGGNGIDLELYGTTPEEQDNKQVTDPDGGWGRYANYYKNIGTYRTDLIYKQDPDKKMWRPIPASFITNSMGVLVNDYGYVL